VEQDAVLATLERAVVFLTSANIEPLLLECAFDASAWTLANLYLASVGAKLLGEDAPRLVGLSEETTCYVSLEYFSQNDPFGDFIVHEVAHILHNCKRATVGLRPTRRKEWLLDIEYRKRETFAYSCEAYARVIERAKSPAERRALAEEYGRAVHISEERVDAAEVAHIVRAAARLGTVGRSSSRGAHRTAVRIRAYGMELDPKYADVIIQALAKLQPVGHARV
jgi:hypothetical protein